MALGVGLYQDETKKASEDAAAEEGGKCLAAEAAEEDEESDERVSSVNVEYSLDVEATGDGYF